LDHSVGRRSNTLHCD